MRFAPRCNQEDLVKAAESYWSLRINRRFDACYGLEMPELRAKANLTDYISYMLGKGGLLGVRITGASVQEGAGVVHLLISYRASLPGVPKGVLETQMTDHWVCVDGEWFHNLFPRGDSVVPPMPRERLGVPPKD